jgi:LemA protein
MSNLIPEAHAQEGDAVPELISAEEEVLAEPPADVAEANANPDDLPEVDAVPTLYEGEGAPDALEVGEAADLADVATGSAAGLGTVGMVLIGLAVVLLVWVIFLYNGLVRLRIRVKEAWSDIDVQLKRRYNLIPNLVESVKGYMGHEREVLENVTNARTAAIGNHGSAESQAKTENMLSGALKTLFAVSENYPELKANTTFLDLQRELTDTEDKIQAARRFYNGNVRDYNTKIQLFPNNLIAGPLGFKVETFFKIENEQERENVKVSFDKKEEKK